MRWKFRSLALILGWLASVLTIRAVEMTYELGGGSWVEANHGSGLMIETELDSSLDGFAFALDDGEEQTFPFFRIWTNERSVNRDDQTPSPITATLDVATPAWDVVVGGTTVGNIALWGLFQGGALRWNGPIVVDLPGDRSFSVTLSDVDFNGGLLGLNGGEACGALVHATFRQVSSEPVPESLPARLGDSGSTVALLGGAVAIGGALSAWLRRCAARGAARARHGS